MLGACFCCHQSVDALWVRFWLFSWDPSPLFGPHGPRAETPIPYPDCSYTNWHLFTEWLMIFPTFARSCHHISNEHKGMWAPLSFNDVAGNLLNSNSVGNMLLSPTLLLGEPCMFLRTFYLSSNKNYAKLWRKSARRKPEWLIVQKNNPQEKIAWASSVEFK